MKLVVKNACKSYVKGIPVLKGLNLNVKSGTLYGLLGSSGCGKTTLLSCIVGLKKLDSGDIYVGGLTPGMKGSNIPGKGVGYMPQFLSSLPSIFTIKQTFWFFGRIYGINEKKIEERIAFLSKLLQLSDDSMLTKNLSGGQLRRVSLAVAMIHEPPLLILDEPTVGLDPLLRQSIWEHLLDLVTGDRKTTVLLTTHYSEEAKYCGTIGIMRRGRLIAEENPAVLLSQANSPILEVAILQLCHQDEEASNFLTEDKIISDEFPEEFGCLENKRVEKSNKWINIIIIYAMLYKHFMTYRRQLLLLGMQIYIPMINIFFAGYMVGEPNGMTINLVNNDWKDIPSQAGLLVHCKEYSALKNQTCFLEGVNTICSFLNEFEENEINWVTKSSEKEALIAVHNGESIGYLSFPKNFSQHLSERMLFRAFSNNETIDGSTIILRMDMTNSISTMWLLETLNKRYVSFISSLVKNCGKDSKAVQTPFKNNAVFGDVNGISLEHYFYPYNILIITYAISSVVAAIILTIERRSGQTERFAVAGVKFGHIVIAVLIFESCIILFQIVILFTILEYFFGMVIQSYWFLAVLTVYLCSFAAVAFGIMLSTLVSHEMEIIIISLFVTLMNIYSSGGMWPIETVTPWYRTFCQMTPVTLPLETLKSIMHRGWGLGYFQVWQGLTISVLYAAISILIGSWSHNRK